VVQGFNGTISRSTDANAPGRMDVFGTVTKKNETTIEITELPVRTWTSSYKEFLEELMPASQKPEAESQHLIEDYREYHSENTVHFVLTLTPENMAIVEKMGLEKTFKLKSSFSTSNMVLFDADGKIAKYDSPLDILKEFVNLRLQVYDKRKRYLINKLTREKDILSNKARFILMVVKGDLELRKRKKADLLKELRDRKFTPWSEFEALSCKEKTEEEAAAKGGEEKSDYDYLLGMPLWNLTLEKVEELQGEFEKKKEELQVIIGTAIEMMWDKDLTELLRALDKQDDADALDAGEEKEAIAGRRKKANVEAAKTEKTSKRGKKPAAARSADDDDAMGGGPALSRTGTAVAAMPLGEVRTIKPLEVKKSTTFTGNSRGRPAAASSAPSGAEPQQKAQKKQVVEPSSPPEPEDGGTMLQRLLRKQKASSEPSLGSSLGGMSMSNFSIGSSLGHAGLSDSTSFFSAFNFDESLVTSTTPANDDSLGAGLSSDAWRGSEGVTSLPGEDDSRKGKKGAKRRKDEGEVGDEDYQPNEGDADQPKKRGRPGKKA